MVCVGHVHHRNVPVHTSNAMGKGNEGGRGVPSNIFQTGESSNEIQK